MITARHTPGPWWIDGEGMRMAIRGNDSAIIAVSYGLLENNYQANASLIAAAPELLASLMRLVSDYEDVPDPTDADGQAVFADARAAIVKATVGNR